MRNSCKANEGQLDQRKLGWKVMKEEKCPGTKGHGEESRCKKEGGKLSSTRGEQGKGSFSIEVSKRCQGIVGWGGCYQTTQGPQKGGED